MSLTPYRRVLARPGVSRLLLFSVLARVPATAAGVVLTIHVVTALGLGYAAAGLVATSSTVGMALGGPWRGRAVDRVGLRRALVPSIAAEAAVWGSAPFVGYHLLLVVAFAGGVLGLPIFTVTRQSLSVLVPEEQRRTAYSLDSMGVEVSFAVGPALGVVVATQVSSTVALLGVGVCMVVAGLALFVVDPPTRSAEAAEAAAVAAAAGGAGAGGVRSWFSPGLAAVLAASAAATLVLSGTDVGVVAVLRGHDAVTFTGVVFAAWSLGSMTGAAVYGALRRPISPLVLLGGLAVLTIPVGLAPSPWLLAAAILPAGALCAPVITATAEEVTRRVPERVRGEAMGWHGSAMTVGIALGAPLAGSAIDATGPWAGFAGVGVVGAVLAVGGLAVQRLLSRRTAAPGPVPTGAGPRDADVVVPEPEPSPAPVS
jgi:MFS family permease